MNELAVTYIWPGFTDRWARVRAAAPRYAICNPASGVGGGYSPDWRAIIRDLSARGTIMLAYTACHYGGRNPEDIRNELHQYRQWYPELRGAFFDEAPTGPLSFLRVCHAEARHMTSAVDGVSVFNPGCLPPSGLWRAMLATPRSVWCTFEGHAESYINSLPKAAPFWRSRQAHLVYAATWETLHAATARMTVEGVGAGYVCSGQLPNPWDSYGFGV